MKKNKLLIITGPTATGKSTLGHKIAEELNGEVISADSRQVYKYMDIGTGKELEKFEWGVNLVEPDEDFSASQWVKYALEVIKDIWSRDKLPIIVGGTGLYIKELIHSSQTLHIPINSKLRARLENLSVKQLQIELQKVDKNKWERMNNSDRNNPRRLVRAIEVSKVSRVYKVESLDADVLIIGLTAPKENLSKRIRQRVESRLLMGIQEEREYLKKFKFPKTLGYNNETKEEWVVSEFSYAKKQLDYLQKFLPETIWFDILDPNVINYIYEWYKTPYGKTN